MLVFYRRAHGWERTGAMLPTEEFLSICWDTQKPYGAFSWPVALEIVTAEIAAHGDEHYRCEIGPASATEIRKLHTQKEATQMATKKAKKGVSKEYLAKHLERLQKVAEKHDGILPSYTWLNDHGLFHSYDVVRKAGKLGQFKRADEREPKPAKKKKAAPRKAKVTRVKTSKAEAVKEITEGAAALLGTTE